MLQKIQDGVCMDLALLEDELQAVMQAGASGLTLNGRKSLIFRSLSRIFPTYLAVKRKS